MRDESHLSPLQAHCLMQLRKYGPISFELLEEEIISIRCREKGKDFRRETVEHALHELTTQDFVTRGETEYFPKYPEFPAVIVESKTAKPKKQLQGSLFDE